MYRLLENRLDRLARDADARLLQGGLRGIEKESLRVNPDGSISRRPHPAGLGSALTHPWITTDFSEALVELVTPPQPANWESLAFLCDLHQFVHARLEDEMLWATSMPCALGGDDSIPIAEYGPSNVGRMKHIYRRGLAHRYGRNMQAIAGVHFNYSVPEGFWPVYQALCGDGRDARAIRDEAYFGLLRNYRRWGWLVLYLFGASPAMCRSFLQGRPTDLPLWEPGTHYGPHATTLRMSDLGYRNPSQAGVSLSMNHLDDYIRGLQAATRKPYPPYEAIGTVVDGEWRQLSTSLLQIDNEYYSYIRPKQPIRTGERPTTALRRAGVAYVEVRALDVSPFDPVGVNQNELRFLEALLLMCLLTESPPMDEGEAGECDAAHAVVAVRGREPGLELTVGRRRRGLREWADELIDHLAPVCEMLDAGHETASYTEALRLQREKITDPALTPSAGILEELGRRGESYFEFGLRLSREYREYFRALPAPPERRREELERAVVDSREAQREIEAAAGPGFEEYLTRYFAGG